MQTLALLIQSPQVDVLGITVVSGDQWRDEEVAHTLRLLEIMGRTDIPVVPGATFPLVRTRAEAQLWQQRYGKVAYAGAWDDRWWHEPFVVPPLPEGPSYHQTRRRRRCALSDSHGPQVSARSHDLRRRTDDQPRARDFSRSAVPGTRAGTRLHGRQPESANGQSRIPEQSPPRIQFLVRSGGGRNRPARALEEDCLHAHRHFRQDSHDACAREADRSQRHSSGTLHRQIRHAHAGRRHHVGRTGCGSMARSFDSSPKARSATWPSIWIAAPATETR